MPKTVNGAVRQILVGGGLVAAIAAGVTALIAGVRAQEDIETIQDDVETHVEAVGLHPTVPEASATAARIQLIEDAAKANASHLKQIDGDVMEIRDDIDEIREAQQAQAVSAERAAGDIRRILDKLGDTY